MENEFEYLSDRGGHGAGGHLAEKFLNKIKKYQHPIFSNLCKDHNKLSFKALSQMVLKL